MRTFFLGRYVVGLIGLSLIMLSVLVFFTEARGTRGVGAGIATSETSSVTGDDILWNRTEGGTVWGLTCSGDSGQPRFSGSNVTIKYHTKVTDADTGAVIACGASVPAGTKVKYTFVPHVPQDISWFITGAFLDSPYGVWVPNAAEPGVNICEPENYIARAKKIWGNLYAELSVNPPPKTLTGAENLGCTSVGNGEYLCTTPNVGTFTPTFMFGATNATYWMDHTAQYCHTRTSGPGCTPESVYPSSLGRGANDAPFMINIPTLTRSCEITVGQPVGSAPTTPTVSAAGGACVVGIPHTINFTATDADNDPLRYGIDWNNDSAIDEWAPASGYVSSGVQQSASRTFSSSGSKTIGIVAQDQGGRNSSWANLTFNCANNANLPGDAIVGFDGGITGNGGGVVWGGSGSLEPNLTIRVVPSLVRQGETVRVNWSATNVQSCTVQGANGDAWTGVESPIGGELSSPISRQVRYTLTCQSNQGVLTKTAVVNALPVWKER